MIRQWCSSPLPSIRLHSFNGGGGGYGSNPSIAIRASGSKDGKESGGSSSSSSDANSNANSNANVNSNAKKKEGEVKPSLFTSITDALDFASVRSDRDAELLQDARETTLDGGQMSREQYAALRRKIGGTYRDFFKDSIDVDGEYVEEGWVDKRCRYCKKDTSSEPRTKDNLGRYAHVACTEKAKSSNFFTRLFSK